MRERLTLLKFRYKLLTSLIAFSLVLLVGKCSKSKGPDNIFLITLDTTRADHIDYSLENNETTPNLAILAAEGVYFKNAYALIPITLPSHASMFYSLHPHELKLYNNAQQLNVSYPSVVEIFKKRGFKCGAVVSLGTVRARWGLNKGFDEYIEGYRKSYLWYKTAEEVNEDAFRLIERMNGEKSFFWIHYSDPHEPYYPPFYGGKFEVVINGEKLFASSSIEKVHVKLSFDLNPGENIVKLITTLSRKYRKDPRLINSFIKYKNVSIAYNGRKENVELIFPKHWKKFSQRHVNYRTKRKRSQISILNKTNEKINISLKFIRTMSPSLPFLKDLYKEEVQYMDEQIGKLVEFLKKNKIFQKSVFLIMGDHGEGLGEYQNHIGHINYLNKLFSHVPLILCGATIQERGAREELVSNLNVAPTLLDIAHIKKPDFMKGDSLLRSLKNKRLLLETYSPEAVSDAFSIIDFPYQIIIYPNRKRNKLEYIHLENDRLGIENIIHTEQDSELKSDLIHSVRKKARELIYAKVQKGEISERDKEILRALGYIR